MTFASGYLSERTLFKRFIEENPDKRTEIIVVIPAFAEPGLLKTLESLASCKIPECSVEVLVHFNAPGDASAEERALNKSIKENIESWSREFKPPFRLYSFDSGRSTMKGWGAGTARKVAMDEALSRFSIIGNPEGIIVSLDADCTVSANYLQSVYNDFYKVASRKACSIFFEHPLDGEEFSDETYSAIVAYELHLRYYYQALKFSGYPEVYHTVGSAFAVRAGHYAKIGGMNRKQAGEDFYFIQKAIPAGGYFYLNSATVYPSPRESARVPFGTGPAVAGMISEGTLQFMTYNPDAFISLGRLFKGVEELYGQGNNEGLNLPYKLDRMLCEFLEGMNWEERLKEIRANTSSKESFVKRFYRWFNMFMVVKYLNWSHQQGSFRRLPSFDAALSMLGYIDSDFKGTTARELLQHYRSLER